jgi:hypothetical protein
LIVLFGGITTLPLPPVSIQLTVTLLSGSGLNR